MPQMPYAMSNGTRLYYEESGKGTPILFVHEFTGDCRSWQAQVRHFSRRYRCITYNARGYPPSDVPKSWTKYSQAIAVEDAANVLRHLGIRRAHIIGCSMGSMATLHFGLTYPRMALSLTAVGAGSSAASDKRAQFLRDNEAMARRFEELPLATVAKLYQALPNRVQLARKDPVVYREFWARFTEHSGLGHANTLRGLQARRPPIYALERKLRALKVPTHMVAGDEDGSALEPSLFVKRVCPAARLSIAPATGHVVNVEEPDFFNRITGDFLALVDSGRWQPRDPRSLPGGGKR
jgi:pimeloyl-ACP methyl ester carboxylesterase